jgi:hypothetical protein
MRNENETIFRLVVWAALSSGFVGIIVPEVWPLGSACNEIIHAIGEALFVAGFLALGVDRYVKTKLVKDVVRDVLPYAIGFGLPKEFSKELRTLFGAGVTRSNMQVIYKLTRVGTNYVKKDVEVEYLLHNNTGRRLDYVHKVSVDQSQFPDEPTMKTTIRHFACWKDGRWKYKLEPGDPAFEKLPTNGFLVFERTLSIPPDQPDCGKLIKCVHGWTEYQWVNYSDHFTFGGPTVGVAFTILYPKDMNVAPISFEKDINDGDITPDDGKHPGLKSYSYAGVMLTGQHLWVQWTTKS